MNLTLSSDIVSINGKSIPKIYGGFSDEQPVILAKQIANIHGYKLAKVNQLINKTFSNNKIQISSKEQISKSFELDRSFC